MMKRREGIVLVSEGMLVINRGKVEKSNKEGGKLEISECASIGQEDNK